MGLVFVPEFFGFASYAPRDFSLPDEDYPRPIGRVMPHIAAAMGGARVEKHHADAPIAETALNTNLTLVTADGRLTRIGRSFGVPVEEIR
jgi:predicted nucleic acid-binding protein